MKMVVADFLLCLLDCFILSLDSSGEAAREDDTNELETKQFCIKNWIAWNKYYGDKNLGLGLFAC